MKVGDVVISRSMNQTMTIESVNGVNGDDVVCIYFEKFDDNAFNELKRLKFKQSDLIFVR